MGSISDAAKRVLFGRALHTNQLGETLLPKRIALPVFASDALSSNGYATEAILLVLSLGGFALFAYAPWIAAAVVLVFLVVVASYRQNVHAYPSGGGDYEVVSTNLGPKWGVFVASALMVDYVLTVRCRSPRRSRTRPRRSRSSATTRYSSLSRSWWRSR